MIILISGNDGYLQINGQVNVVVHFDNINCLRHQSEPGALFILWVIKYISIWGMRAELMQLFQWKYQWDDEMKRDKGKEKSQGLEKVRRCFAARSLPVCVIPGFLSRFRGTLLCLSVGILPVVVPGLPALLCAVLIVGRHLRAPIVPTVRALLGRIICHGPAVTTGGLLGLQRIVTAKGFPEVPGHRLARTTLIPSLSGIHVLVALPSRAKMWQNREMSTQLCWVAAKTHFFFSPCKTIKILVRNQFKLFQINKCLFHVFRCVNVLYLSCF